jgi:hypothetical protein
LVLELLAGRRALRRSLLGFHVLGHGSQKQNPCPRNQHRRRTFLDELKPKRIVSDKTLVARQHYVRQIGAVVHYGAESKPE